MLDDTERDQDKLEIVSYDDEKKDTDEKDESEIIAEMRERFKVASDACSDDYDAMVDDLKFAEGGDAQWDELVLADRVADGRPIITINKMQTFHDRIVGDQRQNRPSIKVRPVDSKADPETAEIMTGLIRNIEAVSDAEVAYDTAFEGASGPGMGYFRIVTELNEDDIEEYQDIFIKAIRNQFSVIWDPDAQEHDRSDAKYCFITSTLSLELFKAEHPDASFAEWPTERGDDEGWRTDQTIRVVEYFLKVPTTKTLYQVQKQDGTTEVVDRDPAGVFGDEPIQVIKEREINTHKIVWRKCNGNEIIDGPIDLPGKYIPVVPVWGKELCIEGRTVHRGIWRHAKDPQRLYNYFRSTGAEAVALAPIAPFLMTPAQVAGFENQWKTSHKRSFPYLLFNPDLQSPGAPSRQFPNQLHSGIQNEIVVSDQELHDTTGLQLASMGKRSNEQSGKAIQERGREGDIGAFAFMDNLARAKRHAGRILVDLIPRIYDTARVIRLLNEDGSEDYKPINQQYPDKKTGKIMRHDITSGKFDVTVSIGPTYQTQREESADQQLNFLKMFPEAAPLISDLIVGNMDWPGTDKIQERLKKMLPPQLQEPEEGAPPPGPPPPDPLQQLQQATMIEMSKLKIEQEREKVKQEKEKLIGLDLENKLKLAELEGKIKENARPGPLPFNQ